MKRILYLSFFLYAVSIASGRTTVSIDGTQWRINGQITYPCTAAEGLLMNVRMVNSTFEDRKQTDFDSDENTDRYISKIPEYNSFGVRAFTLNLQGGFPGYEEAVNSAFRPDGTLRKKYLGRIKRVIEECDKRGMVIILGLFYQRQDQILQDERTVKRAVVNAVNWVKDSGFTNVVIEIANEYDHGGFDHDIIKTSEGEVELIRLVKKTVPGLLVSASGLGHGRMNDLVAKEADFILIHFNGTKVEDIPGRIGALKKYNKPIICNEDDKVGDEAVLALQECVDNGCSWGFMHKMLNQYEPFEFNGYDDDPKVYDRFKQVTAKSISPTDRAKLKVMVDPRVELMGVVFHLAGNPEYNGCRSKPYMKNLNEHFAGHRNHPAVKMATKLRETRGVSYDAVMGMAVHIEDVNSCCELVPFEPRPETLDGRWRINEAREFLGYCRDFVKETDFKAFLAKNKSQYDTATARLQQLIDKEANLAWFGEFFGPRDDVDFNLVISILNGPGNYGCRVILDGRTKIYSIIGAWRVDWLGFGNPTFSPNVVGTVVHEFGHSFCNPLVEKYMKDFESFGGKYFPRVEKQMRGQAYGTWQTMMRESLVRACEVRYAMANGGKEQAEQVANYNIGRGFHWTKELSELLGQYEQQRDKYRTLDNFMPEIVRFFQNYNGPPEQSQGI